MLIQNAFFKFLRSVALEGYNGLYMGAQPFNGEHSFAFSDHNSHATGICCGVHVVSACVLIWDFMLLGEVVQVELAVYSELISKVLTYGRVIRVAK